MRPAPPLGPPSAGADLEAGHFCELLMDCALRAGDESLGRIALTLSSALLTVRLAEQLLRSRGELGPGK